MRLSDLDSYQNIIIQCHNNPDADAIASGFGLYLYFKEQNKEVRFVYGGRFQIAKSNLCLMVESLHIPIEYVDEPVHTELLINVDCQHGAGNVTEFEGDRIAVIDHHQLEMTPGALWEVRSNYGSCATIVWQMLREEGFDVNSNQNLATALYYGLYMDTGQFGDIYHPVDRDMRDALLFNMVNFHRFRNTNISRDELKIAGEALMTDRYVNEENFSIVRAQRCDPNILGLISDFILQTEGIDYCVVYNELPDGYKLSMRSCKKEIKASEMAFYFTDEIGSGGGHKEKAGGYISKKLYDLAYPGLDISDYFEKCMKNFVLSFAVLYTKDAEIDTDGMLRYHKLPIPVGYVPLDEILPKGTPITVRTLEGDIDMVVKEDDYLMIGVRGEVYPSRRAKFEAGYHISKKPYRLETDYVPSIHNRQAGTVMNVTEYARSCVPTGEVTIFAKPLKKRTKIFTRWDEGNYMLGQVGDYLAVREDDPTDIYIIEKNIFAKTYTEVE